jgi:hypothetical protein
MAGLFIAVIQMHRKDSLRKDFPPRFNRSCSGAIASPALEDHTD